MAKASLEVRFAGESGGSVRRRIWLWISVKARVIGSGSGGRSWPVGRLFLKLHHLVSLLSRLPCKFVRLERLPVRILPPCSRSPQVSSQFSGVIDWLGVNTWSSFTSRCGVHDFLCRLWRSSCLVVAAKSARFLAGSIVVAVVSACSVRDSVSSAVYTPGFGGCKASSALWSSSRTSYSGDDTGNPGIRGNEENLTFPWVSSKVENGNRFRRISKNGLAECARFSGRAKLKCVYLVILVFVRQVRRCILESFSREVYLVNVKSEDVISNLLKDLTTNYQGLVRKNKDLSGNQLFQTTNQVYETKK
ncbi:LOW QUALITY PROTEIN: hypothetical protein YC2023_114206 [Brassica napus]